MTRKSAYYALAVVFSVVLAAGMVIGTSSAVLADNEGSGYGTVENSYSSGSENSMDQAEAAGIREPVETGALPDRSVDVDSEGWVNMNVADQEASPELQGFHNIQSP